MMRGRYELNKYTKAGEEAARRHFSAALARDPGCVPALAGLAISHIHEFEGTWPKDPDRTLAEAQRLAERAVALDEDDACARYALASAVFFRGGFDLAIQHCNRALESNQNDYHNLCSQGWFLTFNGEVEAGLACNAKALSLNLYAPNGCLMVAGFGKSSGMIRTVRYEFSQRSDRRTCSSRAGSPPVTRRSAVCAKPNSPQRPSVGWPRKTSRVMRRTAFPVHVTIGGACIVSREPRTKNASSAR